MRVFEPVGERRPRRATESSLVSSERVGSHCLCLPSESPPGNARPVKQEKSGNLNREKRRRGSDASQISTDT